MDNRVDLPGYKYYVDGRTGARPEVFVGFLNISPAPGGRVNGSLLAVSPDELGELDARERNYARVDVSGDLARPALGRVWCYVGTPDAVERCAIGGRNGRLVIAADYHDRVRRAFGALDAGGLAEFDRLTGPAPCPIVDLVRVDL